MCQDLNRQTTVNRKKTRKVTLKTKYNYLNEILDDYDTERNRRLLEMYKKLIKRGKNDDSDSEVQSPEPE